MSGRKKTLRHFFALKHKKAEHARNFRYADFRNKNTKEIIDIFNTDIIAYFFGLRNVTANKIRGKTFFITQANFFSTVLAEVAPKARNSEQKNRDNNRFSCCRYNHQA